MGECTDSGKPLIAILMAVYEPRMSWLCEQLVSLNQQNYPNLRLYVRDDGSQTVAFSAIEALVRKCITAFPYSIQRNPDNLGSNATFERLTAEAEGEYFAYCDQDDVWLPKKLSVLQEAMERKNALLACSDMYIIDANGKRIANSITKIRRHHVFRSGEGLAPKLLISNFATGCAMLIRAETAKAALPFCPDMVHDHYLALCAAETGRIVSLADRLISYRIHGGNQTPLLSGANDRESYYHMRIETLIRRLNWLKERFSENAALNEEITAALAWAKARAENFRGTRGAKRTLLRYRRFGPLVSVAEIVLAGAPEPLFRLALALARRNIV